MKGGLSLGCSLMKGGLRGGLGGGLELVVEERDGEPGSLMLDEGGGWLEGGAGG